MQLSNALLAAAMAIGAFAAPVDVKSMTDTAAAQWTIESFTRTCNDADTSCHYSFSIDTHTVAATPCAYDVSGNPASRQSYNSVACGAFTISSSWSGQFGEGNGFSTLAVTNGQQIIYPAYTDKQLVNGVAVSPDQSYAPQNLP